jgi:hypothetical protein
MQIPDILAPIEVEILFFGGKAAAKRLQRKAGTQMKRSN